MPDLLSTRLVSVVLKLVGLLLPTAGSVMPNMERMVPSSIGFRYFAFYSPVPNSISTSMLPVSGALQLQACGAS